MLIEVLVPSVDQALVLHRWTGTHLAALYQLQATGALINVMQPQQPFVRQVLIHSKSIFYYNRILNFECHTCTTPAACDQVMDVVRVHRSAR